MLTDHANKFPKDMAAYFSSRWSREDLWTLELPIRCAPLNDFAWHLHYPFWSSLPPEPRFDLKPIEVLHAPHRFAYHYKRMLEADTRYPLLVASFKDKLVILDGLHRLAKLYRAKSPSTRFKRIPDDYVKPFQ